MESEVEAPIQDRTAPAAGQMPAPCFFSQATWRALLVTCGLCHGLLTLGCLGAAYYLKIHLSNHGETASQPFLFYSPRDIVLHMDYLVARLSIGINIVLLLAACFITLHRWPKSVAAYLMYLMFSLSYMLYGILGSAWFIESGVKNLPLHGPSDASPKQTGTLDFHH